MVRAFTLINAPAGMGLPLVKAGAPTSNVQRSTSNIQRITDAPTLDVERWALNVERSARAFTLIELLVVITIIVILLALLTPALDKAIMQAELTTCAARQRSIVQMLTQYAVEDGSRRYPSGRRDGDGFEHLPFVRHDMVTYIESMAGNNKSPKTQGDVKWGIVPKILTDTSFEDFGYRHESLGYVIGYMYLGGRPAISKANDGQNGPSGQFYPEWDSPTGLRNRGSGDIIVCWNSWTPGLSPVAGIPVGHWSVSAHIEGGGPLGSDNPYGGGYFYTGPGGGGDVRPLGAIGGNVAFTDGATSWRDIEDMHVRVAASGNGEKNESYPAMW